METHKKRKKDDDRRNNSGRSSPASKLRSEERAKKASGGKLRFEKATPDPEANKTGINRNHGRKTPSTQRILTIVSDQAHSRLDQNSDDNSGTDALNRGSQFAQHVVEDGSNVVSRWQQRHTIKKEYVSAKTGTSALPTGSAAEKGAEKVAKKAGNAVEKMRAFVSDHKQLLLIGGGILLIVMLISGMMGSCSVMFQGGTNVIIDTSYTAEDEDILGVEADYCALEYALQARINNIQTEYPGYDEYNVTQDQIGHNPYELASYLTVVYENYTRSQGQGTIQTLFNGQYELTIEEVVETRYRTEIRTETVTYTDPETGETFEEEYEYEEEVPYDYFILNVTLKNKGLGASFSGLSDDQMMRYGLLMQTLGNRPEIFGDNPYAIAVQEVLHYDIPGEALTDERFARMIHEAEKYLGYPYVWGGSSPSTSFDCSGFVCWVVNHCNNGWNVGRTTAEGLRNICAIIPKREAKPGDLIFFQGTYETYGASHVGIYVGNNMMSHCGNPIQYTSIDNSYWQAHFYCFGRLP